MDLESETEDQPNSPMKTPKKFRPLSPCLQEHQNTSEKRIRFGNRATIDFTSSDPASSISPIKQHVFLKFVTLTNRSNQV